MQNADDRRAITKLLAALGEFQKVDSTMPIQIAVSFLTVAQYEGRSLREYCKLLGVAQSTMSRHMLDLGPRNRRKEPGFGLIQQTVSIEDLRKHIYTLAPAGRALLAAVVAKMEDRDA